MKNIYFLICFLLFTPLAFSQAKSGRLVIVHTNDMHSMLTGFSPEMEYTPQTTGDDFTLGGFSRISAFIKEIQKQHPENCIVMDAGDFLMGSFFHISEAETGFQLHLMKEMGYDVVALGNHEFDYGPRKLSEIINKSMLLGEIPAITCCNLSFQEPSDATSGLASLYEKEIIRSSMIIEKAGFKIGVFGLLGYNAAEVAPNMKPLTCDDALKTAKKVSRFLKTEAGADIVICLSHSGLIPESNGTYSGEDVKLAENCPYIDVIVSGHSHTCLTEALMVNDVIIVQTGAYGVNVGKLELNIESGKIVNFKYQITQMNDEIQGDYYIFNEVEKQKKTVDSKVLAPLGLHYNQIIASTTFDLVCDEINNPSGSNLGPFLADAIYYYTNKYSPQGTDVALIATGVIRDKISKGKKGYQTPPDIFRVVSLGEGNDGVPGYPLAKIYLTASELKKVLEILYIAPSMSSSNYCYYSGITVYINPDKGMLNKVRKIEINGEEIDFSKENQKLYGLVANSYMLEFVGLIRKISYGLVKVFPKDADGNRIKDMHTAWIDFDSNKEGVQEGKEWLAVLKFIESFEDCNADNIPDIPDNYRMPVTNVVIETSLK